MEYLTSRKQGEWSSFVGSPIQWHSTFMQYYGYHKSLMLVFWHVLNFGLAWSRLSLRSSLDTQLSKILPGLKNCRKINSMYSMYWWDFSENINLLKIILKKTKVIFMNDLWEQKCHYMLKDYSWRGGKKTDKYSWNYLYNCTMNKIWWRIFSVRWKLEMFWVMCTTGLDVVV